MNDGDEYLAKLSEQRIEAQGRHDAARRALDEAKGALDALEVAERNYRAIVAAAVASPAPAVASEPERRESGPFAGMSQMEALRVIATRTNGVFRVRDATAELVREGLINSKRNKGNIIYTLMRRSKGKFEQVGPGKYRLVDSAQVTDEGTRQLRAL